MTSEREETLDEIIKLSMMLDTNETERWENVGRPKNDGYINGSHSGYIHALRDLRQWIDRIKLVDQRKNRVRDTKDRINRECADERKGCRL